MLRLRESGRGSYVVNCGRAKKITLGREDALAPVAGAGPSPLTYRRRRVVGSRRIAASRCEMKCKRSGSPRSGASRSPEPKSIVPHSSLDDDTSLDEVLDITVAAHWAIGKILKLGPVDSQLFSDRKLDAAEVAAAL